MEQKRLTKSLLCVFAVFLLWGSAPGENIAAAASQSIQESSSVSILSEYTSMSSEQRQALKLLNDDRKKRNLAPLQFNSHLSKLAESYARDMIDREFFSHRNPEGQSPFERMQERQIAFNYAGENIAFNESVYAAQQAFMHSPEHKANILSPHYTQVGIGVVKSSTGRVYVVQEFIDG